MGLRTTLVLLSIVAGLGVVLMYTSHEPPPAESAEIPALDGRSLRHCTRLRWQLAEQPAHEFERGDEGLWRIVEPIVDRASSGYLEQIVSVWDSSQLVATEHADDDKGRHETGLGVPEATFFAEWPDGHRVEYDIGAKGPLGDDRFLRREGKIWRGGTGLLSSMRVNLDDLRDRQVFLQNERFCTALRVEHRSATGKREVLELQRPARGERGWRMTSPVEGRAEPVAAARFVTAILALRADLFLPGVVRPPEGEPEVVIVAKGGTGEERLQLWIERGAAYGQLPGRLGWFQCDPRTYESVVENAVEALRARALVGVANVAEDLAEIVVDPGQGRGDRVRLVREAVAGEWQLVEPVEYRTHPTPVNELIQAVNNLRAVEFVDGVTAEDPAAGLQGASRLTVSLRPFEAHTAHALWLGAPTERGDLALVHACRADEPGTVVLVPRPAVEQLQRPWTTYCALDVVRIMVPVERIVLERASDGTRRGYGRQGERWRRDDVEGDRDDVRDFVNEDLRDLRARACVDLRDGALGPADWTLAYCRSNDDRLQLLRVWDREGRGLVVQPESEAHLGFELGANVSKQLRALWQ